MMLGLPLAPETMASLRHGAVAAVIDAFDRGVQREFMLKVVDNAFNFCELVRRMELALAFKQDAEAHILTMTKIDEAIALCQKAIEDRRKSLADQANLMHQMPREGDTIN